MNVKKILFGLSLFVGIVSLGIYGQQHNNVGFFAGIFMIGLFLYVDHLLDSSKFIQGIINTIGSLFFIFLGTHLYIKFDTSSSLIFSLFGVILLSWTLQLNKTKNRNP